MLSWSSLFADEFNTATNKNVGDYKYGRRVALKLHKALALFAFAKEMMEQHNAVKGFY